MGTLLHLLLAAAAVPAESRQLLLSVAPGWDSTSGHVRPYVRDGAKQTWRVAGEPMSVSYGRTGLAWGAGLHTGARSGPVKREGDGRSPAGVFELRVATGYEPKAPTGTQLSYRHASTTLRCVDDPRSRFYNQLVDEAEVTKDWSSAEDMRRPDDLYRLLVWVGHNDAPVVPEKGSCIFLHLRDGAADVTAGCTAFDAPAMERLVLWLDPAKRPVFVQLPEAEWAELAKPWDLPTPATGSRPGGRVRRMEPSPGEAAGRR